MRNPEETRMAKNGEDCYRLEMTTKYKFGKIEKHQGDNNKPRRNKNGQEWPGMAKNGQEWPRMEKIVTDCKWLQNISLV